jgi:hypothetical protein
MRVSATETSGSLRVTLYFLPMLFSSSIIETSQFSERDMNRNKFSALINFSKKKPDVFRRETEDLRK